MNQSGSSLTIDFETTSRADLKKVGAWKYSLDPSTEVLCVGWDTGQWRMGEPAPATLFEAIANSETVHAHNAYFEFSIWRNVCERKYNWPAVPDKKWRCTAAQAAACSISRALGQAGRMLGLSELKDETGKSSMMKLTRGAKMNDEGVWQEMLAYNRQDVIAEKALSEAIPELSEHEQKIWEASERMNYRGFPVDRAGAKAALAIIKEHTDRLTAEFQKITGIEAPTMRTKFIEWLVKNGVDTDNTRASTLDEILADTTSLYGAEVFRAIEILRSIGRSSTAKYITILNAIDDTDRIRGCFLYHGAVPTGRWAGRLVQPHNFPKGNIKNIDEAWQIIKKADVELIQLCERDPMEFVSSALRGVICAPEGREFLVADYASIEARITAWLADEKSLLKLFHEGGDAYITMAESVYNRKIGKKSLERQLGKQAILGLGFGMGYAKFLLTCRIYNITFTREQICAVVPQKTRIDLANRIREHEWDWVVNTIPDVDMKRDLLDLVFMKYIVEHYRAKYTNIVYMWKAFEDAAKNAVRYPGEVFKTNKTVWRANDRFLMCKLPSGRIMRYFKPRLGAGGSLHYIEAKGNTGKFGYTSTYGGRLTENVVQATARDVMADGMLRLEANPPYHEIIATVHDELVSEIDKGVGDIKEFEKLITAVPEWATGMPISADSWRGRRYRK